jgi:hypothetical protein
MIGYDPTKVEITPADPELASRFHFDSTIATQLSRIADALHNLSELDDMSYADRNTVSAPTLIGELAAFASATNALHSDGILAQQTLLDLASGKELTPKQAVFVEQIKQVSALLDTLQVKKV